MKPAKLNTICIISDRPIFFLLLLFSYSTVRNPYYYELFREKSSKRKDDKTGTTPSQAHLFGSFVCLVLDHIPICFDLVR